MQLARTHVPPGTKLTKTVETRHLERRKANSQRKLLKDSIAQQSNSLSTNPMDISFHVALII